MGAGASGQTSRSEPQFEVPATLKGYPPPELPKYLLPDHTRTDIVPVGGATSSLDVGYDWSEIDAILKEGKNKKTDTNDIGKTDVNIVQTTSEKGDTKTGDIETSAATGTADVNVGDIDARRPDTVVDKSTGNAAHINGTEKKIGRLKTVQTSSTYRQKNNAFISFAAIDAHARAAIDDHSQTFSDLFTYLRQGISNKTYRDMNLVRAILVWLGSRPVTKLKPADVNVSTPSGLLQHLKRGSLNVTGAFTLLCRAAKLPCVLIPGYAKVGDYEPGDEPDEKHEDVWCSVRVDQNWQLVHPVLVCQGVFQPGLPGSALIENDTGRVPTTKKDSTTVVFNEEFFMPKPEDFIYRCYAHDIQWHLLPIQRTLKSANDFQQLAFLSPAYFKLGLKLLSTPHCVQYSTEGVWMLELKAPKQFSNRLLFAYKLIPVDVSEKTHPLLKPNAIQRLVLQYRNNDFFTFEVRLPTEGSYFFELQGGFSTLQNVMKVRILCGRALRNCVPLPVDTGSLAFGPGPATEDVGLLLPSRPSGVISVLPTYSDKPLNPSMAKDEETVTLTFQYAYDCNKRFAYAAELLQSAYAPTDDTKNTGKAGTGDIIRIVTGSLNFGEDTKAKQLDVKATVPADGEYALVIKAADFVVKKGKRVVNEKSIRNVCYYLLTTIRFRDPTGQRLARVELAQAMDVNDLTEIRRALAKCDKFKVPATDDEISAAKTRLEYLMMKHDISESIRRRNIPNMNDVLRRVLHYKYRNCLVPEVKSLRKVREELLTLDGFTQPTPGLRDALEELFKTSSPQPETHNTLIAVGLLIGFQHNDLHNWSYIHSQMRITTDSSDQMNIIKRVEFMEGPTFPWLRLDRDSLALTAGVLSKYTYQQVAKSSLPAASFYKWVKQMLTTAETKFEEKRKKDEERAAQNNKHNRKSKRKKHRSERD